MNIIQTIIRWFEARRFARQFFKEMRDGRS